MNITLLTGTEFSLAVKTLDELSAPTSSINYTVIPGEAADFVTVLKDAMDTNGNVDLDKILIRWRFDGRSEAAGIDTSFISGIIRNVLEDSTGAELFINTSKHITFTGEDGVSKYDKFLENHLDSVVERMFEIRGTP